MYINTNNELTLLTLSFILRSRKDFLLVGFNSFQKIPLHKIAATTALHVNIHTETSSEISGNKIVSHKMKHIQAAAFNATMPLLIAMSGEITQALLTVLANKFSASWSRTENPVSAT